MAAFPKNGDLFEGRYRIDTLIGSGGFARVYRARQEDLGRNVALKVLTPSGPQQEQSTYSKKIAQRFVQEAKLVSKLRDAHTITMYDYGQTDSGLLYMVFEYVDGDSLVDLLEHGPLSPSRVMKIIEQTLMSLQEAHALGVMHRDIKPGNIMVFDHIGRTDQVKVLDFGIAKLSGPRVDSSETAPKDLTADGALVGTPRYMSPEQIRGEPLTPQSDLYSLGLVAYELLVGEKAIASNSSVTIIGRQLDPASFQLPGTPTIPYGVRHVVDRLLAKDREQRYGSADEALSDVQRYEDLHAPERVVQLTPVLRENDSGRLVVPDRAVLDEEPTTTTNPRIWIGGLLVLLIAAATLTIVASTSAPRVEPSLSPPTITKMLIATRPVGLEIEVNGRTVGRSPLEVNTSELHFPAVVAAKLDDEHERKVEVVQAAPSVTIDFSDVVRERDRLAASAAIPAMDVGLTPQTEEPRTETNDPVEMKPAPKPAQKPKPQPKPKPKPKPEPLPTFVPMDKHE